MGLHPVIAPLLAIKLQRPHLPPAATLQAVVVASGNAVAALPMTHRDLPLLAVGRATADRARDAGFGGVISADGDARALAELVARICTPNGAPLLLVAGSGQGDQLARDLRAQGFRVVRRAVYAAMLVPALPETARAALAAGKLRAALFFSAETARQCVRLLQGARLHEAVHSVEALAIGQPAAVALQALPWRRIRVAARPTQDAMLALLR
jgi:uroporphyrinogen-III synthase